MVRRKIQRLEVVVVRLDNGSFSDGVPKFLEDTNNLAPRPHHRMLRPNRTPHPRKRNINALSHKRIPAGARDVSAFDEFRNPSLQFVDANPGLALRFFRRALQPQIVNLCEDPVLPRHPPVAKRFQFRVIANLGSLSGTRSNALARSLLQRRRRIVSQFGNGVCHDDLDDRCLRLRLVILSASFARRTYATRPRTSSSLRSE